MVMPMIPASTKAGLDIVNLGGPDDRFNLFHNGKRGL